MLTPAERRLRARVAAYALHAQGGTSTHAGTAAFLNRFDSLVDPDGTLPAEERARRAAFARKGYMALLALRAAKARRARSKNKRAEHPSLPAQAPSVPEEAGHGSR